MSLMTEVQPGTRQQQGLQRYYRWHARIYDATRWSFLFGRRALMRQLGDYVQPRRILEVGCGTGTNLQMLARCFPRAHLTGVDLSTDMLNVARRKLARWQDRLDLIDRAYDAPLAEQFDLIVFSYSLSMMNPGWEQALHAAWQNLSAQGVLAVVDFSESRSTAFRRWMGVNHVRMEGQLLPVLQHQFTSRFCQQRNVYAGLWQYLLFIGSKSMPAAVR
jgi:S-adenosylmethionine-diacylgycerolhomoserine-N-methlytransferase